jgi:hypothetical protein
VRTQPSAHLQVGAPDHETAVESPMPTASSRTGHGLSSAFTRPVAAVVACIYIGVPLALFTHDFSGRLLATVVVSAIVFAAAFGGVIRVLRTTTSTTASQDRAETQTVLEMTRPASPGYTRRAVEDCRQMAEA